MGRGLLFFVVLLDRVVNLCYTWGDMICLQTGHGYFWELFQQRFHEPPEAWPRIFDISGIFEDGTEQSGSTDS